MAYKYWTNKEDTYLRTNYGVRPVKEMSVTLGRTENSIRLRAKKIGLKSAIPHKPNDDIEILKDLIWRGYHPTHIAVYLKVSTKCIYNRTRDTLGEQMYKMLLSNRKRHGRHKVANAGGRFDKA